MPFIPGPWVVLATRAQSVPWSRELRARLLLASICQGSWALLMLLEPSLTAHPCLRHHGWGDGTWLIFTWLIFTLPASLTGQPSMPFGAQLFPGIHPVAESCCVRDRPKSTSLFFRIWQVPPELGLALGTQICHYCDNAQFCDSGHPWPRLGLELWLKL